jgi:hypothetical protein
MTTRVHSLCQVKDECLYDYHIFKYTSLFILHYHNYLTASCKSYILNHSTPLSFFCNFRVHFLSSACVTF